jgi:hypothetical protein
MARVQHAGNDAMSADGISADAISANHFCQLSFK